MLVERRFDTGEVVLNYAEGPNNGPPLWLLHGVLSKWQFYHPIIPYLQSRWHIHATDLRGHGKSEHTPQQYGLEYYYNDLQQFIDNKITEPVTLVGHSLGGVMTCMLASKNSDKVKAAILLDPPLFFSDRKSKGPLELWKTFHKIGSFKGTLKEKIRYTQNLDVSFTGSPMKFVDAFGESAVLDWSMNNFDPGILDLMIKARELQEFSVIDGWYDPEKVIRSIDCPVLLIQAGKGLLSLSESDRAEAQGWFKDLIQVRLMGHDHPLGISQWNTSDVMRPISVFLESLL